MTNFDKSLEKMEVYIDNHDGYFELLVKQNKKMSLCFMLPELLVRPKYIISDYMNDFALFKTIFNINNSFHIPTNVFGSSFLFCILIIVLYTHNCFVYIE